MQAASSVLKTLQMLKLLHGRPLNLVLVGEVRHVGFIPRVFSSSLGREWID